MDKKASAFTPLSDAQITLDTELVTAVPGGALGLGNYKFTVGQLIDFFGEQGSITVIPGIYASDAAAITAGGVAGQYYLLSPANIYGIPYGYVLKIIQ